MARFELKIIKFWLLGRDRVWPGSRIYCQFSTQVAPVPVMTDRKLKEF